MLDPRSAFGVVGRFWPRRVRERRRLRFVPSVAPRLESRTLLSGAKAAVLSPGGTLPHEAVGSTYDISIPGPKLGSTHEITVGPDGNLWITQELQDRVVHLSLDGQFTFFPTGPGSEPHGIEFDAQGRLWITLQGYNTITQMDLNGNIVANHTIPYPDSNPHGLTVAPTARSGSPAARETSWGTTIPRPILSRSSRCPIPTRTPTPN